MFIFIADIDSQEAIKGNEISSNGPNLKMSTQKVQFPRFLCAVSSAAKLSLMGKNEFWVNQHMYGIQLYGPKNREKQIFVDGAIKSCVSKVKRKYTKI